MKVVVTDYTFPTLDIEKQILEPVGCEIVAGQCKETAGLMTLVSDADAVITQFAPINAEVIAAMSRARVIVRYGIGVDNVDLNAARERGIPVCNVPDYCIDEVADHTLAFILAASRNVVGNCVGIRGGSWSLAVPLTRMYALCDLTIGVVGFGRIGRAVTSRLGPFKCRRLVHDPLAPLDAIRDAGCEPVELAALLAQADIVTLHCPSTPQTRQMLNAATIEHMKPGVIIINVARGDLIETSALIAALQAGKIAAAALDVCDPEPIPASSPLCGMENVVLSSHVASASVRAVRTLRETAANIAARAIRGEPLPNIVNDPVRRKSSP